MLIAFSDAENQLKDALLAIAQERLTQKQKLILNYLKNSYDKTNVTKLVPRLAKELNCSESAIWNNLNSLKKSLLICYGSLQNKGADVILTPVGKLISQNGGKENGK